MDAQCQIPGRSWWLTRLLMIVVILNPYLRLVSLLLFNSLWVIPTMASLVLSFLLLCFCPAVDSLDNGLGLTPPMGWNTWNTFFCAIDETLIHQTAEILVETGLAALGYTYLNLDDCWMHSNRTEDGKYTPDPVKFPSGMKALGDFLHSRGLRLGLYTSAGTKTCAGFPGSLHHEQVDAQTFADWGVDYLKYDNCYNQDIPCIHRYAKMRDALNRTGRSIFYSLCQWGKEDSYQWAPAVGNAWRTTGDIGPTWPSIARNFWDSLQRHVPRSQPGAWADLDMLEVGNGNLTIPEQSTHFGLWVMAKSPLLLGMDLRTVSKESIEIVKNRHLIKLHQDPHFPAALCYVGCDYPNANYSVFATTHDREIVAMLVNWSSVEIEELQIGLYEVGVVPAPSQFVIVENLWKGEFVEVLHFGEDVSVKPIAAHGNAIFRLTLMDDTSGSVKEQYS